MERAYSWQSPSQDNSKYLKTHTDVFFNDLIDYDRSSAKAPYCFGHFMFEKDENSCYAIIDGQQRLTTIVIMLSALFRKLSEHREFTDMEVLLFEDMIKRKSHYHFSTVDYDDQLLKDHVIDQIKKNRNELETQSAKRFVKAFDFFTNAFADKDEQFLARMLKIVSESNCTVWVYEKTDFVSVFQKK